jgi:hypothetical protein
MDFDLREVGAVRTDDDLGHGPRVDKLHVGRLHSGPRRGFKYPAPLYLQAVCVRGAETEAHQ